ncbi:MAG: LacI family DNA-binding transcriptional regulator [Fibrella sp.]|nr:LacI family DNA-binding transcriptional regulator [Armatimonadota bacterium]
MTIRDVAEASGFSKTTTAYILNDAPNLRVTEKTRLRVLEVARRLGYRRNALAAALSSGRINTFGVFLPDKMASSSGSRMYLFHKDMLTAVVGAASRAGVRIMPMLVDSDQKVSQQEITDQRIEGVLVTYSASDETAVVLRESGLPCVYLSSGPEPYVIQADNFGGICSAVDHLVSLGHRRIVHFANEGGSSANQQRIAGFCEAMRRHGVGEPMVVISKAAVNSMLQLPVAQRPTAFTTYSDQWGVHVIDIARENGLRVPEDISVVGFDDGPLSVMARPQLTTVHNPLDAIADAGLTLLLSLCDKATDPVVPSPLPTHLVLRNSTAPPLVAHCPVL